ncbi:hypothetical protein NFC81_02440 [Salinispirillum sp. LH 10-3-1]|uniref:DUF4282 domain-containing protein n=1 Tax=Salinispirillum sp. LH 10-3-1 TaxID=2952525 RepID=A0AB38YII8_9GAMM
MIKNEISFDFSMVLALGWALFWRWLIIGAIPGVILGQLMITNPWLALFIQLSLSFIGLALAVNWVLGSGSFSSLKIIIMEQAHYQELATNSDVAVSADSASESG